MGALYHMRDDPADAPIPAQLEPHSHHCDELIAAKDELARLNKMTPDEIVAAGEAYNTVTAAHRLELIADNAVKRERYLSMIAQAERATNLPDGLQRLMLNQLRESLDFDTTDNPLEYVAKLKSAEDHHADRLADAKRDVAYHLQHWQEEIERTAERNAWLTQLHTALKGLPE